jgi:hypothetical protein
MDTENELFLRSLTIDLSSDTGVSSTQSDCDWNLPIMISVTKLHLCQSEYNMYFRVALPPLAVTFPSLTELRLPRECLIDDDGNYRHGGMAQLVYELRLFPKTLTRLQLICPLKGLRDLHLLVADGDGSVDNPIGMSSLRSLRLELPSRRFGLLCPIQKLRDVRQLLGSRSSLDWFIHFE